MQQHLSFEQNVQTVAAKLRGAYLEMSADIEFLLVDITCVCLLKDEKERNVIKEILLASNMLSKKIDFAATAIKIYNPEYYKTSKQYLSKFQEFKDTRNKLSHTRITGDKEGKTLEVLYFTSFKDGELKDTPINVKETYEKLIYYAAAIRGLGDFLIPKIYQERYLTRYNNVLSYPSNRSMSHWYNYQRNIEQ